jgi:hypothetical protein
MTGWCGGDPAGSAPTLLISVALYGYSTFGYVCIHPSGSTCQYKLLSLDAVKMNTSGTYTVKAETASTSQYSFGVWMSNAGTFANRSSAQTIFTATSRGWLTFTMVQTATENLGGYVTAMAGNNSAQMSATLAQGSFTIPNPSPAGCNSDLCINPGLETIGIWVGLGDGLGSGRIWQAGVDVDIVPIGPTGQDATTVMPWYEAYPRNPVHGQNSFPTNFGDRVQVSVWANGSQSS